MICKLSVAVLAAVFAIASAARVSMPGGFSVVKPDDDGFQNAMKYAVAKHNAGSNDLYLRNVSDVIEAKSQVVSGVKYVFTVKLAKTNCRKSNVTEDCVIHPEPELASPYQCTFTVWSRPWLSLIEVTKESCPETTEVE
ncbi:cystatin C (amyloid angiopathy and cerebral hemorrhage) [Neosynchiropus ocellatus]